MNKYNHESFKVVSVSSNTNSFGLHGVILVSQTGKAFEIATSYLYKPTKGQVLIAELTDMGNLSRIKGISYELPRKLAPAPSEVIREVWGK